MRMEHRFTVPVPVEVAWPALLDPERVAPCMPGATLTSAEGNNFAGSVKVRLGPVSLQYKGTGTFAEVDAEAKRVVIDASGKDVRGAGTASATVTAVLTPEGEGTAVSVDTDLKVTGKPAQMGRGLISDVAGKIIDQFAACLASRLAGQEEAAEAAAGAPAAQPVSQSEASSAEAAGPQATAAGAGAPSAAGEPAAGAGAQGVPGANGAVRRDRATRRKATWRLTPPEHGGTAGASGAPGTAAPARPQQEPQASADAIDLLSVAGTPVLKRLAPALGGLALIVTVVLWWRRRRKG